MLTFLRNLQIIFSAYKTYCHRYPILHCNLHIHIKDNESFRTLKVGAMPTPIKAWIVIPIHEYSDSKGLYAEISQFKYFSHKTGTQFMAKHSIPKQELWHIFLFCCDFTNAFKVIMTKNVLTPVEWFGVERIYFQNFRDRMCLETKKHLHTRTVLCSNIDRLT